MRLVVKAVIFIIILIGFLLGWLFPIEGPFDYVYDNYASQPAHKRPQVVAPMPKLVPVFDPETMEELNEEWEKQQGLLQD
jgi:hypothetical protein